MPFNDIELSAVGIPLFCTSVPQCLNKKSETSDLFEDAVFLFLVLFVYEKKRGEEEHRLMSLCGTYIC